MVPGLDDTAICLETNHLNLQPAMAPLLRTIQRMSTLSGDASLIFGLVSKQLSSLESHPLVRLFFLRLLLNHPVCVILKPRAGELLFSVIDCCFRDLLRPDQSSVTYFVKDVVFLLCDTWADVPIPAEALAKCRELVTAMIEIVSAPGKSSGDADKCVVALVSYWLRKCQEYAIVPQIDLSPIAALLRVEAAATGGASFIIPCMYLCV
jgi:hypothetical protein